MKTDIKYQSEEKKVKKIFAKEESVLNNAKALLEKGNDLINQCLKNNIISKDEKFYDAPKKSEKNISEKIKQESDQSIPKWVQVPKDRFDFIKLIVNKNKGLSTMIDSERYTLNDVNELVNKQLKNRLVKVMPLNNTMIW